MQKAKPRPVLALAASFLPLFPFSQDIRLDTLSLPLSFSEISMISFTTDGKSAFLAGSDEWEKQLPYLLSMEDSITMMRIFELDTLYNGAISPSGNRIIFARRGGQYTELFLTQRLGDRWSQPTNLSTQSGISGGYFSWFDEQEVYFYIPDGKGDLVKGILQNNELNQIEPLQALNTDAVEFSPYVDKDKRFILFTRYAGGDPSQQGIMISKNQGTAAQPQWGPPSKIKGLTYGWGACISGDRLYYSDGKQILSVRTVELGID
ncbi:MAG: hypothetical protein AAGA85_09430 [Bacteroidota bacterium]